MRLIVTWLSFLVGFGLVVVRPASTKPTDIAMTQAQFWASAFGTAPRQPMAGDANGDGRADLLSFNPQGEGGIDASLTSYYGKPVPRNQARTHFGREGIVSACGAFARSGRVADVLAVFADGSIRVATGMAVGSRSYERDELAGTLPAPLIPKLGAKALTADFDGDGKPDVLIVSNDAPLLLLLNRRSVEGKPLMKPLIINGAIWNAKEVSAGQFTEGQPAEIFWLDAQGHLLRASLKIVGDVGTLLQPRTLLVVSPQTKMVVGRFCGGKAADILVGQKLLPGGEVGRALLMPLLPTVEQAEGDISWIAADFDGNGRDDLLRLRRTTDRFGGEDVYIHFSYGPQEITKGYLCSANDGLLDVWKTGKINPGGLNLAEMGCKVGRRDVLVELERFDNVPLDKLRANMEKVIQFYAALPIQNPDGSSGITLHILYQNPIPFRDHDQVMREFDSRFPTPSHRGVVHTMFAENDGPLYAKICGDNGHFNGGWAEFLHEFGHQLYLTHEGFHDLSFSAVYPSLMNYGYSYGVYGRIENIRYSSGVMANFPINEEHLSEVLPFPIDQVRFLSGLPYNYRLRAAGPQTTLIDWNWNGILGETDVQADINYSHGVTIGPRYDKDKIQTAPVMVAHGVEPETRLLMLYGNTLDKQYTKLSPVSPGSLAFRMWVGKDRDKDAQNWSPEVSIERSNMTGDPTAIFLGDTTYISYPTPTGAVIRTLQFAPGGASYISPPVIIPDSIGAEPTIAVCDKHLILLLWRGPVAEVGYRLVDIASGQLLPRPEASLGFRSAVPVGAVAGDTVLHVGRIAGADEVHAGKTEIVHLGIVNKQLQNTGREWVDGTYAAHRMTLLWRAEAGFKAGRLYCLSGGITRPDKPWAEQYITQQVAYPEIGNGWQWRKYYQNDYASVSAPGACWYKNNIVYALRLYSADQSRNDVVSFGFYGTGATPESQGDFDDISHLRDFGLSLSIPTVPQ